MPLPGRYGLGGQFCICREMIRLSPYQTSYVMLPVMAGCWVGLLTPEGPASMVTAMTE